MFTPPAQLNVFDFLFNRGGMPVRSCLTMAGGRSIFHWGCLPCSGFRARNSEVLHALCSMLAIPLGFGHSLSRYPIKLHQLRKRVELFSFPTPWD